MAKILQKKKSNVNKTAAIKSELEKSADGSPQRISQTLAKQGIKVSPAYVSTIKSKINAGKRPNLAVSTRNGHSGQTTQGIDRFATIFECVLESGADEVRRMADRAEQLITRAKGRR